MEFIIAARNLRAFLAARFLFTAIGMCLGLHATAASATPPISYVTYPAVVTFVGSSDSVPWQNNCMSASNYNYLPDGESGLWSCIQTSVAAVGDPPGSGSFGWSALGLSGWSVSATIPGEFTATYTDHVPPDPDHQGMADVQIGCPISTGGGKLGSTINDAFGRAHPNDCLIPYVQQHQRDPGCPSCTAGNPINPNSGNKYETVTDYRGAGPFPLVFSRTYNSLLGTGLDFANYARGENLGVGWTNTIGAHLNINILPVSRTPCQDLDTGIYYYCPVSETSSPDEVTVWHADGGQAWFELPNPPAAIPAGTSFPNEQGGQGQLTVVNLPAPLTGKGFQYLRNDGYSELYNASGQLLSVTNSYGLAQTYSYNTNGQVASITDPFGRSLTFTYDTSGRVSTMTNPLGGKYTYAYDTSNRLQSVTNPDNSVVQYTYGENGAPVNALTGLIDEKGVRYATWGYNAQGQAISSVNAGGVNSASIAYTTDSATGDVTSAAVTEATGLVRTLDYTNINGQDLIQTESAPCVSCSDKMQAVTYDANGFIASKTDFDGNVTQYVHDSFGNELSRTEAYGTADARTITTQWNYGINQPVLITEPGRTTAYSYDTVGHVLTKTVTDTAANVARTTGYTYNAAGLLATVTDPLNHVTTYGYDAQGDLSSITNALNQVIQITSYDANGMPLTIVDPNGVSTTLTYDARQRLTSRTVDGAETQYAYDKVGQLTKVTLPTGSYLSYTYDGAHRLTDITDSVGDTIHYTLDNEGNRTEEDTKDPSSTLAKKLQRTYNTLNQLIHVITAGIYNGASTTATTTYAPDSMGNVTSITDPLSSVTTQGFDALNRLASVVDPQTPVNGNTNYNYDPLDRVQDVTDPVGLNTHYTYDAFGDVIQQVSPDTGTTTYTYDKDGNRLTKTDARGLTASYGYDGLNRLTGITYLDTSRNVTYTYDQGAYGIGHLAGLSDATGTTAYQYDSHGNTTQKVVTLGGHAFTLSYQYDTADNLTGMTYPSGMQVHYTRDSAERVTEVDANGSPVVSGITYEPFGPITGLTFGNGLTETRTYDEAYQLQSITASGVQGLSFVYNLDGDITNINDAINSGNSQTLGYDVLNRLTSAIGAYGSQGYQYDLDGNRTQETLGGTATTLSYANQSTPASNELLSVGGRGYQYDAMGNTINDGIHAYDYDAAGRLTGYDSTPTAYLYNGLGQRSIKFPVDNTAPTISITSPTGGVSGTVTVKASVADDFGVSSVQFKLDGANLGAAVTTAPYQVPWNTSTASIGTHTLTATATDPGGNTATSAAVTVAVLDVTPPTVSISAPANGSNVSGTVTVSATAADNVGVTSVQFQLDGADLGAPITTAPYSYAWDTTANVGSHTLTAIASDAAGNTTTSAIVNVTVPDTIPPTVTMTAPANNASISGTVTLSAASSDNVGVASVQFRVDGVNLGSPITAAPYVYAWDSTTYIGGTHSLTAVAKDGAGNTTTSTAISVTVNDITATATNGSLTTNVNVAGNGTLGVTLGYPTQTLTLAVVTAPLHGTVTITNAATGAFTYIPAANYIGADSFTFHATDSYGTVTNTATESVTVNDVAATATAATIVTNVNVAANQSLGATLGYPIQTLIFAILTAPVHGAVNITNAATGAFTYTPTANYVGPDSFTFDATDSYGKVSNTATESVTVNDIAATATAATIVTNVNVVANRNLGATLGYPTQTLTFAVVTTALHGTVTITNAATGAFTYTPAANYVGTDSFTFKATDGYNTASNIATENITVNDVAAMAVNGSLTVTPNVTTNGSLAATPAYTGQTFTYKVQTGARFGTLILTNAATGAFSYFQNPCGVGMSNDSFTFTVTDGHGVVSNAATETINMSGPAACLSTTYFGFETRLVYTVSATHTVTLMNWGSATLTGMNVTDVGNVGQFTVAGTCTTMTSLVPGQSCGIDVTFVPTWATNPPSAAAIAVSVSDSAGNSPQTFSTDGTALSALASLSATSLNFGADPVGHLSGAQNVTLTNTGTGDLTISSITVSSQSGSQYSETNNCGIDLAAGATCTISVKFLPGVRGVRTGFITITDDATSGAEPQIINLTGQGT